MSYTVKATDLKAISLNESNTAAAVLQNVALILGTRQGSIPFYREFGLPMKFLDKPMNVAKTIMVAEVETYVPMFEPRAKILSVKSYEDKANPGKLIPIVEVGIDG